MLTWESTLVRAARPGGVPDVPWTPACPQSLKRVQVGPLSGSVPQANLPLSEPGPEGQSLLTLCVPCGVSWDHS